MDAKKYLSQVTGDALRGERVEFRVVFGTARISYHKKVNGISEIHYGTKSIERSLSDGFREYATVAASLGVPKVACGGQESLHRLALHECAHALQVRDGHRYNGSVHNDGFVTRLRYLMDKLPYNGDKMYSRTESAPTRDRAWCAARYSVGDVVQFDYNLETQMTVIRAMNPANMVLEDVLGERTFKFPYAQHDHYNVRPFEL